MKNIQLYHHKTDGGAEYLTDNFVETPSGEKEGVFKDSNIIIRLDGDDFVMSVRDTIKIN